MVEPQKYSHHSFPRQLGYMMLHMVDISSFFSRALNQMEEMGDFASVPGHFGRGGAAAARAPGALRGGGRKARSAWPMKVAP